MSEQTWFPSLMFLSLVLQSDEQWLDLSYGGKATYGAGRLFTQHCSPWFGFSCDCTSGSLSGSRIRHHAVGYNPPVWELLMIKEVLRWSRQKYGNSHLMDCTVILRRHCLWLLDFWKVMVGFSLRPPLPQSTVAERTSKVQAATQREHRNLLFCKMLILRNGFTPQDCLLLITNCVFLLWTVHCCCFWSRV